MLLVLLVFSTSSALKVQSISRRAVLGVAAVIASPTQPLSAAAAADGMEYMVLQTGDGPKPQRGQKAVVDYTLWLGQFEGKQVDSSKGSVMPPRLPSPFAFTVGVGEVIPGWDRAVRDMAVGEKRRLVVPPSLGYGEKGIGPIPGGASLYFEMELLELKPMPVFSEKQQAWLDSHPEP